MTLAVPESLQPLFAAKVVEATTMALPEDDVEEVDPEPALARILDHEHDAIVVGPGPAARPGDRRAASGCCSPAGDDGGRPPSSTPRRSARSPPMDGWWERDRPGRAVLTPHAGEFARLRAGSGTRPGGGRRPRRRRRGPGDGRAATRPRTWGQVVVLKGARTVIAAPDGAVAVAPFENPALATGGTGDVLAGTIGALLAQGLAPFDAARLGVYLHGLAGDAVRERFGDAGLLASDLPDAIADRPASGSPRSPSGGAPAAGSGSGPGRGVRRDRRARPSRSRRPTEPAPSRRPSGAGA